MKLRIVAHVCALCLCLQTLASGPLAPAALHQTPVERGLCALLTLTQATPALAARQDSAAEPSPLRLIPTLGDVPRRVVSLDPSATQTLVNIGKASSIVGMTYVHPMLPGLEKTPLVGSVAAPHVQNILALKPDVVIANPAHYFTLAPLIAYDIPVLWLDTNSVEDAEANVRCLGVLMQSQGKAENIIAREATLLRTTRNKVARLRNVTPPRALCVLKVEGDKLLVPADSDMHNQRLTLAGAQPPRFGATSAVLVDAQKVREFRPQYMCTDVTQSAALAQLLQSPRWTGIKPEVLDFPHYLVAQRGVNYGTFALWLATSLHPAAFAAKETQLQDDALLSFRALKLPFTYVLKAQINQERIFDIPAKTLVVQFNRGQRVLSSQHGWQHNIWQVGNHYTPQAGWPIAQQLGMNAVNARIARVTKQSPLRTVLLHTGADIDNVAYAEENASGLRVGVLVTAGVSTNALRAGADSGDYVEPGTINIIALTNRCLSDAAMTQAMISITEAKTAALQSLDIRSSYSGLPATGTGTDAIIVVGGEGADATMTGGHTKLGELLARATTEAVREAIGKQNHLTVQRSVIQRLAERNISLRPQATHLPQGLSPAHVADYVDNALTDPYYAGFLGAALALSDSASYGALPDMQAFEAWCVQIAKRHSGSEYILIPPYYGTDIPLPLHMALNALAAGAVQE